MMIPIVFVMHPPWTLPVPSQTAFLALVGLALISTALAYLLFFRIMRTAGPSNVMLVTFLIPVSAILLGSGLLGEDLLPRHFAGMAAIFVGLALIDGRVLRIAENTEPLSTRIIPSGGPVRAVLEVIAGTARKFGIAPGDRVASPIFNAH